MNKKTYIAPQAEFIQIKSEGMLAASGEVTISNDPSDMESGVLLELAGGSSNCTFMELKLRNRLPAKVGEGF